MPRPISTPSAEAFRQTGYTIAAANFPMTDAAVTELCKFNGIGLEQAPPTWYYAPNERVRAYWEEMAEKKTAQ